MKIHDTTPSTKRWAALAIGAGLIGGISISPLHAVTDESLAGTGYNEDEWYDPGDWFDGNNIERNGNDTQWWDRGWNDTNSWRNADDDRIVAHPYHYYYWDPVVVGWATYVPDQSTAGNDKQDAKHRNANRTTRFEGTVDGFRDVDLKLRDGKSEKHSFVRVRLKDGEKRVISLGKRLELSDLDLNKGDEITATGNVARIDNRDVLVARQIEVDDNTFRIREDNRPHTGRQVSVEGTVKDFQKSQLGDANEKNLIVRMELENGRDCVVDFGRGTNMSDLNLEKDARVKLKGERTKVDGKTLIVARSLRIDGEPQLRDRSDPRDQDQTGRMDKRKRASEDDDQTASSEY